MANKVVAKNTRILTEEGRKRISAAQVKRWKKYRAAKAERSAKDER
jgi:hypothetical protein